MKGDFQLRMREFYSFFWCVVPEEEVRKQNSPEAWKREALRGINGEKDSGGTKSGRRVRGLTIHEAEINSIKEVKDRKKEWD